LYDTVNEHFVEIDLDAGRRVRVLVPCYRYVKRPGNTTLIPCQHTDEVPTGLQLS